MPAFDVDGQARSAFFAPWPTDDWLIGCRGGQHAVLGLRGKRDDWGDAFFDRQGWQRFELGKPREDETQRRFDKGGNVLASPPLSGYPHGRLVVGRSLQPDLKDFFRRQKVQTGPGGKLLEIDTDWLQVGHVDEILAFGRAPESPGFRVVLPDFEAGLGLLDSVPADRAIFYAQGSAEAVGIVADAGPRFLEVAAPGLPSGQWCYVRMVRGTGAGQVARIRNVQGRRMVIDRVWDLRGADVSGVVSAARAGSCEMMPIWFETPDATSRFLAVEGTQMWLDSTGAEFPAIVSAGELARDPALRRTARECAARLSNKSGGVPETLEALGIGTDDVLRLPVLFSSDPGGAEAGALVPNPINLVSLDRSVVLLRPFGPRSDTTDDDSDVFAKAWRAVLNRGGLRPVLLDGWDTLHRRGGGAHCGSNVIRKKG
ncbi:MAG: hypothetical protein JNM56_39040 [Planctomycetia bacterium]|nr:hypothetical protein [Planctomycetia bacterium]